MLSVLKNISFADKQPVGWALAHAVCLEEYIIRRQTGHQSCPECHPNVDSDISRLWRTDGMSTRAKVLHLHKPVFDGIVVDVIYVSLQIGFISNLVFPEPPLPYTALSCARAGNALGRFMAARG